MPKDAAREYTDRKLRKLETELGQVYSRALTSANEKWAAFTAKHEEKASKLYEAVTAAERGGNATAIKEAKAAYKEFLEKAVKGDKAYKKTVEEISRRMAKADQEARRVVNKVLPDVYAHNYNALKTPKGYVLRIIEPNAVKNIAAKEVSLLKAELWNKRRFNAELLRGFMDGESIPKLAKRLKPFVGGNRAAAVRTARTAVTSAENGGRLDSMKDARELGLIYKKQWIATHDARTRESHAEIDGEIVDLDEPFSNGCYYPADPAGEAEEVYNCRCTMNRILWGIEQADGSIKRV